MYYWLLWTVWNVCCRFVATGYVVDRWLVDGLFCDVASYCWDTWHIVAGCLLMHVWCELLARQVEVVEQREPHGKGFHSKHLIPFSFLHFYI